MLNVMSFMPSVLYADQPIMLSVVMLSVIMLSVVMMNVMAPGWSLPELNLRNAWWHHAFRL